MLKAVLPGGLLILLVLPTLSQDANPPSSLFDKPLHETHSPLPVDPSNPQSKPSLSCYYYTHLMVKQVDIGEEGASDLTITYLETNRKEPPCLRNNSKDEKDLSDWCGYFSGVKGKYVFFRACDGANGGLPFAVYDSGASKIFVDSAAQIHSIQLISPTPETENGQWYGYPLKLRYQKAYLAPCSLQLGKIQKDCWEVIKRATGLTDVAPPDCGAAYKELEKRANPAEKDTVPYDPSVITYEVEAVVDESGVIRVTPISKVEKCFPAD